MEYTIEQWEKMEQSGFMAACNLVWGSGKQNLTFFQDIPSAQRLIGSDILITQTLPNEVLQDRIGSFFRTYNFVHFISESDYFKPEDVLRELAHILLLRLHNCTADFKDCSLTVFCSRSPREALRFLQDNGYAVVCSDEDPNIMYTELCFGIRMQIVVVGDLASETNEYAPFNVLATNCDEKREHDFELYRETSIQDEDTWRLEQYSLIAGLLHKRHDKDYANRPRHRTQEEILESLFPGFLEEYTERKRREAEERILPWLLGFWRDVAARYNESFEEVLDYAVLPEWLSREEALAKLKAM